jgi:hypothetical protein
MERKKVAVEDFFVEIYAFAQQVMHTTSTSINSLTKARLWPMPPAFFMAQQMVSLRMFRACRFAVEITTPNLAFLQDCLALKKGVKNSFISIGALLEMASCIIHMLCGDTHEEAVRLQRCAFSRSVGMPFKNSSLTFALICEIDPFMGYLQIDSGGPQDSKCFEAQSSKAHKNMDAAQETYECYSRKFAGLSSIKAEMLSQMMNTTQNRSKVSIAKIPWSIKQSGSGFLTHPTVMECSTQLSRLWMLRHANASYIHRQITFCDTVLMSHIPSSEQSINILAMMAKVDYAKRRSFHTIRIHGMQTTRDMASTSLSGVIIAQYRPSNQQQAKEFSSPAMQLFWQAISNQNAADFTIDSQRWMLLSSETCTLRDVCKDEGIQGIKTLYAVCQIDKQHSKILGEMDVFIGDNVQLQLLIMAVELEQCFLVQPQSTFSEKVLEEDTIQKFSKASLWTFRAIKQTSRTMKMVLITRSLHTIGPYDEGSDLAGFISIGMAPKTLACQWPFQCQVMVCG